jgi:hypothetical protein
MTNICYHLKMKVPIQIYLDLIIIIKNPWNYIGTYYHSLIQ